MGFDPLTIGLVLSGISTVAGGVSAWQQGEANASALRGQAAAELEAQKRNEELRREDLKSLLSAQIAATSAAGIEMAGTPMEASLKSVQRWKKDIEIQRYNTAAKVGLLENQARLSRSQGMSSLLTAGVGAAGYGFMGSSIFGKKPGGVGVSGPVYDDEGIYR